MNSDTEPAVRTDRGTTDAATAFMDSMRAIAASLVVVSHVILVFFDNQVRFPLRGLAVTFLFILSGFLISRSLLHRARKPGPHVPNFLADRCARILTPLVPAVLAIALLDATVIDARMGGDGLSSGPVALVGNLLLLLDYPLFQALHLAGIDVSGWRIRPYNTAEPYWTVAIEFWLYVAAAMLLFCGLLRERVRTFWLVLLTAVSVPVVIWNAADGPGKSLTLIWLLGAAAGFLAQVMGRESVASRAPSLGWWIAGGGALALAMRVFKLGFDPYDLQTAFLLVTVFLGLFLRLNRARSAPRPVARTAAFFASYSYSLYLVHNTILVIVFENAAGLPKALAVALGVALAHACALLLHHGFEKHHRRVGSWLRPRFTRALSPAVARPATPVVAPVPVAPEPVAQVAPAPAEPASVLPSPAEVIGGAGAAATAVAAAAASLVPDAVEPGDAPSLGGGLQPQ